MDDSPIEQVRLTVPPTDDKTLQALTFRTWVIGIPICAIVSVISAVSDFRQQLLYLSPICINIIVLILGKLMANSFPSKVVRVPCTKWGFSLNPGPFNLKEHVVTNMLANSATYPYGFDIVSISKIFYHKDIPWLPAMLLVLSIQFLGFGFAGIFIKLLVDSPYMWWPSTLVDVSFYRALHETEERPKGKISRYQFLIIVVVASFAYAIIPVYFFPSITALSFACWIWKDSITAQQIGSAFYGLGVGSFALDWMTISGFLGSPMATPTYVIVNMMAGFVLFLYVLIPLTYWNDAYHAKRFPIFSTDIFDADGQFYNVSRILDDKSFTFLEEAYDNYSPLYFSTSLVYYFGCAMAACTSSISHVALFYGRSVWQQFTKSYRNQSQDVHTRLMKQNYESIPSWWFYSILFSTMAFAIAVCEIFSDQLQLRYWGVLLASALVFIFLFPEGVLAATANSGFTTKLFMEIIIGYLHPGKPIANLAFSTYGFRSLHMAVNFTSSLKTSHYMKIPPKIIFLIQIVGTLLSCVVGFTVGWWFLNSVENICQPKLLPKGSPWTCPGERRSFTVGVTWGVVGPTKMFYPHGTYSIILVFFMIGIFAPVPVWILSRMYPEKTWIRLINWSVIFGAGAMMPPATPVNFYSWFVVGIIFNHFIFRKFKGWWARYNYVLSAGLDTGAAFLTVSVTLLLEFQGVYGPNWWGLDMGDHCPLAHCPTAPGVIVKDCPVIK